MRNVLSMAKTYHTSAFEWLEVTLIEFCSWIRAGNAIVEQENEEIEKRSSKR